MKQIIICSILIASLFDAVAQNALNDFMKARTKAAQRAALGIAEWTTNTSSPGGGLTSPVGISDGGTGGTTPATARTALGIPKVWNMVKDFNAPTDGTTDGTTQLNTAIASVGWGDVLFYPEGKFVLSPGIKLTNNVTIRGAGMDRTTFWYDATSAEWPLFEVNTSFHNSPESLSGYTAATTLSADASAGTSLLSVTSTNGLIPGNLYALWDNNSDTAILYRCEIVKLRTPTNWTAGTVQIEGAIHRKHLVSETAKLSVIPQYSFALEDFTLTGAGYATDSSRYGPNLISASYTSNARISRVRVLRFSYAAFYMRYMDDATVEGCELIGYANWSANQGYFGVMEGWNGGSIRENRCYDGQFGMVHLGVDLNISNNYGENCCTPFALHSRCRRCIVSGTRMFGSGGGGLGGDNGVDNVFRDNSVHYPQSSAAQFTSETNLVVQSMQVIYPSNTGEEPETDSGAIQLFSCESPTLDGVKIIGSHAANAITINGGTGLHVFENCRFFGSDRTRYLVNVASSPSAGNVLMRMVNCTSTDRLFSDSSGVAQLLLQNCSSGTLMDQAVTPNANTPNNGILGISGVFGNFVLTHGIPLWSTDSGRYISSPATNNLLLTSYVSMTAPGRGASRELVYAGYTNNAQTQVTNLLPHDVLWVAPGQRMRIINGAATVTMDGSKAEKLPIHESGVGDLFVFGTNTLNRWVEVQYLGKTNYVNGTSRNWRIVDYDPALTGIAKE